MPRLLCEKESDCRLLPVSASQLLRLLRIHAGNSNFWVTARSSERASRQRDSHQCLCSLPSFHCFVELIFHFSDSPKINPHSWRQVLNQQKVSFTNSIGGTDETEFVSFIRFTVILLCLTEQRKQSSHRYNLLIKCT